VTPPVLPRSIVSFKLSELHGCEQLGTVWAACPLSKKPGLYGHVRRAKPALGTDFVEVEGPGVPVKQEREYGPAGLLNWSSTLERCEEDRPHNLGRVTGGANDLRLVEAYVSRGQELSSRPLLRLGQPPSRRFSVAHRVRSQQRVNTGRTVQSAEAFESQS
jgi:hypothetical protein